MSDGIKEICKINLLRVEKDKSLKLCPMCGGTTFTPCFLGVTLCAYCGGRGVVKNE